MGGKKREIANIELHYLCEELRMLVGRRLSNFYEIGENWFGLKFEKIDVECVLKERINISKGFEAPKTPTNFAMGIRKHIRGVRLKSIMQHELDRILVMEFEGGKKLVFEMFSNGNLVLLDEKNTILQCYRSEEWRGRKIARGEPYVFPASEKKSPFTISYEEFAQVMDDELFAISAFTNKVNLGVSYAKKVFARAGVDEKKVAGSLSDEEKRKLYEKMREMLAEKPRPTVYEDDYTIFPDKEGTTFRTISEMLENFYYGRDVAKVQHEDEKKKKLLQKLEKQKEVLEELRRKEEECRAVGDAIYSNKERIERALELIHSYRKAGIGWEEIKAELSKMGFEVDEKKGKMWLEV